MGFDIGAIKGGLKLDGQRLANTELLNAIDSHQGGSVDSLSGIQGPSQSRSAEGVWDSKNWAQDLAPYIPTQKFDFRVEFEFNPPFNDLFKGLTNKVNFSDKIKNEYFSQSIVDLLVKKIDRPQVNFEYEDVNFYNYRSKVLKKISHKELTMEFYDDSQGVLFLFFNCLLMAYSPIASPRTEEAFEKPFFSGKRFIESAMGLLSSQQFESTGMNFRKEFSQVLQKRYGASVGTLAKNPHSGIENINVFKYIKLRQFYNMPSPDKLVMGGKEFYFVNPRILSFNFDEVDYANTGDFNFLTVTFDYDALYCLTTPANELNQSDVDEAGGMMGALAGKLASGAANRAAGQFGGQVASGFGKMFGNNPIAAGAAAKFGQYATGGLGSQLSEYTSSIGKTAGSAGSWLSEKASGAKSSVTNWWNNRNQSSSAPSVQAPTATNVRVVEDEL